MPANKVTGKGGYNAICDQCGFKFKASELRRRPTDNALVCKWDWEPRHPQEFIRTIKEGRALPFIRTEPDELNVSPSVNCNALDFQVISMHDINLLLAADLVVFKMRVVGGGTLIVPEEIVLTVHCELNVE